MQERNVSILSFVWVQILYYYYFFHSSYSLGEGFERSF